MPVKAGKARTAVGVCADGGRLGASLRRPLQGEVLIARDDNGQQLLGFIETDPKTGKHLTGYEYAVLVTNTDYEILSLGQLYRDRADAEPLLDDAMQARGW